MKLGLLAILGLLLAAVPAASQDNEKVQIVLVGRILKIDVKGRVITVRERFTPRRGAGMVQSPPNFPGSAIPPMRRGRPEAFMETRVSYSPQTTIKSSDGNNAVVILKVGDSVRITGRPGKKEVIATEIEKYAFATSR